MKKITLSILIMTFLGFGLMAQEDPRSVAEGYSGTPDRDNEFICDAGSVFSQVYSTYDNAYYADNGYSYSRVADDYTASSPFTSIRFWGGNFHSCPLGATETFIIKFYNRNAGDPTIPGTEVNSFTVTVTPTDMGINAPWGPTALYQIDVNFNTTVTLLDGWVSVTRQYSGDGCEFATLVSSEQGGSLTQYQSGTWLLGNSNLLFCLGDTAPQSIPLSNWPIYLGILLIGVFLIISFRRKLA